MDQNFIVNLLQKAKEEAFMKGINANTVIIDEHLRHVKPFGVVTNYSTSFFKPMILGMEIDVQKLPEPISFIVYESDLTDNQKLINSIRKQAAKDFSDKLDKKVKDYLADIYNLPYLTEGELGVATGKMKLYEVARIFAEEILQEFSNMGKSGFSR